MYYIGRNMPLKMNCGGILVGTSDLIGLGSGRRAIYICYTYTNKMLE